MRLKNAGKKVPMEYRLKFTSAPEMAIHQKVGTRSTAQIDPASTGGACFSEAPRAGSGSMSSKGIKISAGAAATIMAARHPILCAMGPLKKKLSAPPTGTPSINKASGLERFSAGNRSPIQLVAVGAAVASPTPTPNLEITRKE